MDWRYVRITGLALAIAAGSAAAVAAQGLPAPLPVAPGGLAGLGNAIAAATESAPVALADAGPIVNDRAATIDCLAKAIAHEAGNEPEAGQQAVAQVILNRARHRAFPASVCGVVFQGSERRTGCQFTFTCDGSLRRSLSRRVWDQALRIAAQAAAGALPPTIGRATHYHADYVLPRWAPALVRVRTIGAHIFYRFPGDPAVGPRRAPAPALATAPLFSPWGLAPAPADAAGQ